MLSGPITTLSLLGLVLATYYSPVHSNAEVLLGAAAPLYENGTFGISATAPFIGMQTRITSITFTINGRPTSELTGLDINPVDSNVITVVLVINNIPASLNNNTIGCTAQLDNGDMAVCSPQRTLQIQGTLDEVGNLNSEYSSVDRTLNISWTAPPAITIRPATRPEIFYCVEINNGTTTESIGCNRTGDMNEETSVIVSGYVCGVNYDVTITPFNRVGDGVNSNMSFPVAPMIMERRETPVLFLGSVNLVYTYPVLGLACTCMASILDASVMGDLECELNATAREITITTNNVTSNRYFDAIIIASNSRGSHEGAVQISTLDAFDLMITGGVSELDYSVTFIPGTSSLGVFVSVIFRERGLTNFKKSFYFVQNRASAAASNQLAPTAMGNYTCEVYDLESSGEITSEQPVDQEVATVSGPTEPENIVPFLSLENSITCSSDVTEDLNAVSVTCQYNTVIYRGYRVYIQSSSMDISLQFVESTESGSAVIISSTGVGEHLVFVFPMWRPNIDVPDGRLEPAYRKLHNLTVHLGTPGNIISTSSGPSATSITDYMKAFSITTGVLSAVIAILIIIIILSFVMFMLFNKRKFIGGINTNLKQDPALETSHNISYGFVPVSTVSTPNQMYDEVSHTTAKENKNPGSYEVIQPSTN